METGARTPVDIQLQGCSGPSDKQGDVLFKAHSKEKETEDKSAPSLGDTLLWFSAELGASEPGEPRGLEVL